MAMKSKTADRLREPPDHGLLDHYRCRTGTPRCHVLVEDTGQEISHGSDRFSRAQHIAKEAAVLHPRQTHHFGQFVERLFPHSLFRQGRAEPPERLCAVRCGGDYLIIDILEILRREFRDVLGQLLKLV
jgi:hypothetical protein